MANEDFIKIVFLTVVTDRKKKDKILTALHDAGMHVINTVYGKGTIKASVLMNTLGLFTEENKAVITCLTTKSKADKVLELLINDFKFDKPATGIAFTVPVDALAF